MHWAGFDRRPERLTGFQINFLSYQMHLGHSVIKFNDVDAILSLRQGIQDCSSSSSRPTGWAKLNGANAVSFVIEKHVLENLIIFGRWNNSTVHLRTLRRLEIEYFSPEGATKDNAFLCSSILAVLLTPHNFYIETILLTNNFYGKHCLLLLIFIC